MTGRRIFLDVGAHDGQTLAEVVHPAYRFDRIYAFEPMPVQFRHLTETYAGTRSGLVLFNYGLSDRTGIAPIYGSNDAMEASTMPTKIDVEASIVTPCVFVEASAFFARHLRPADTVVMKLNCEGSEIAILSNLLTSGEISKITEVMIDFDIRKVAGHEHEEADLLARFAEVDFTRFHLCEEVMQGDTHQDRIAAWLTAAGQGRP